MESAKDLNNSFDALDWACAFVECVKENPAIATDKDTMLGWFANALMRGFDEANRRIVESRSSETTKPAG